MRDGVVARPPDHRVSAIICAFTLDRWDDLCAAIGSLQTQTRRPDEIILVVDHNETLLARAVEQGWEGVLVVPNRQAQGLSGGRNTGIAVSSGDLLAFLDDDAVAGSEWIENLVRYAAEPVVLGCASIINPIWLAARPRWFPDEFLWTVGCSHRGLPTAATPVRNVFGGAMMIRRAVFDAVGDFHKALGRSGGSLASCEETEICLRASAAFPQGRFMMVPTAKVGHKVPGTRLTWGYFRRRCVAEGRSKAYLAKLVQRRGTLNTERDYVLRTLIKGVLRGLADTALGFDPYGVTRAAAIIFGLCAACYGYALGCMGLP